MPVQVLKGPIPFITNLLSGLLLILMPLPLGNLVFLGGFNSKNNTMGFFVGTKVLRGSIQNSVGDANWLKGSRVGYARRLCRSRYHDKGLSPSFVFPPPLQILPPSEVITSWRARLKVEPIVENWLQRGVIREIFVPQPLFFSRIFFVLK